MLICFPLGADNGSQWGLIMAGAHPWTPVGLCAGAQRMSEPPMWVTAPKNYSACGLGRGINPILMKFLALQWGWAGGTGVAICAVRGFNPIPMPL